MVLCVLMCSSFNRHIMVIVVTAITVALLRSLCHSHVIIVMSRQHCHRVIMVIVVTAITVALLRSLCHSMSSSLRHVNIVIISSWSSYHHGHRCHRHHSHTITVVVSQPCHHRYVTSTLSSYHHGHRCHRHHSHTITVVVSQPLHHRHVNIVIVTSWSSLSPPSQSHYYGRCVTAMSSSSHHGHRCHRHHSHTVTVVVSQPCHHRHVIIITLLSPHPHSHIAMTTSPPTCHHRYDVTKVMSSSTRRHFHYDFVLWLSSHFQQEIGEITS